MNYMIAGVSGSFAEERLPADVGFAEAVVDVQGFEEEFAGADDRGGILCIQLQLLGQVGGGLAQAFHVRVVFQHRRGGNFVADLQGEPAFELERDFVVAVEVGMSRENGFDRFTGKGMNELVFGAVAFGKHEFEFAARAGCDEGEVIHPGDDFGFIEQDAAAFGGGDDVFGVGDRAAHAHAGGLVDVRAGAGLPDELFEDFVHVVRNLHGDSRVALQPGVLFDDVDAFVDGGWVVGADDGADAVFQRRHDAAAVGVVFGVGGEDHADVEVEADGVAADLDVAFFEDVEEADLDFGGEVGEFVDGEDAAVGARDKAEVHGGFVGKVTALSMLDEVDFADEVGDGDIRCGKLFVVAGGAVDPFDGSIISLFRDEAFAGGGGGVDRIVVDFGAGEDGDEFVEEVGEHAEDAGFGLAAEAKEEDVMFGEEGVDDLGDDGVAVAEDAGEEVAAAAVLFEFGDDVFAEFVFDGEGVVTRGFELADGSGLRGVGVGHAGPFG
jgi:hypothetical protein